jgi:hypothetical protein
MIVGQCEKIVRHWLFLVGLMMNYRFTFGQQKQLGVPFPFQKCTRLFLFSFLITRGQQIKSFGQQISCSFLGEKMKGSRGALFNIQGEAPWNATTTTIARSLGKKKEYLYRGPLSTNKMYNCP